MGAETLAIASLASTIIGTGVQAVGGMMGADARASEASYRAAIAQNNAKVSEQNARYAEASAAQRAEQQSMKTRAMVGEAVAAQASNGVDVNTGSALDVRASIAALGELSGLVIRNEGAREASNYRTQGAGYTASAGMYERAAADAEAGGAISAASTLLGGITSAGNMAIKDYQAGVFPKLAMR